jgi:dihydrofolate reductase
VIRHIVALDSQRGMAKDGAMPPWKLRGDETYFTEKTQTYGGNVLMGKKTFIEALKNNPLKNRTNYVVTHDVSPIADTIIVNDLQRFLNDWPIDKDLWIIGGAEIFAQTMDFADELYVTEIDGDFGCDRSYPDYKQDFELLKASEVQTEHNVSYRFCIYKPRSV